MSLPQQLEPLALAELAHWEASFGPPRNAVHAAGRVKQIHANLTEELETYRMLGPEVQAEIDRRSADEEAWHASLNGDEPGTLDLAAAPKQSARLLAAVAEAMSKDAEPEHYPR